MPNLGSMLTLEYGEAMPAEARSGHGFPVFGSNGEVGRHRRFLIGEPGVIVGRKGSVGKVTWSAEPFWPIDTTYWVKCAPVDRRWMYWVLTWLPLTRLDSSTGVPGLNRKDVYRLMVEQPPLSERLKIAEVLDTLNTAIQETESIIAKLKAVKQGLLHDLLTRGIDENGELRPQREEAPDLYRESPVGWTPKEWGTPALVSTCSLIRDGTHLPPQRVKDGPLLLSVRNMRSGRLLLTDQDTRVSEAFYSQMHKHWEILEGDVLLAIVGATIGKTAMVSDMPKFTLQRSVAVLRGKPDRLLNSFLLLYLGTPQFQASLWARVNQTAQPGIYLDQLGAIPVHVPPLEEQEAIRSRLQAAQHRIDHETSLLEKLRKQKAGLMDDLLTGRVRVTPLLEPTAG